MTSDPNAVGERGGEVSRRRWMWGAAGAAAALGAGAAWWWRMQDAASSADLPENQAAAQLWSMPWRTPQDQPWDAAPLRGQRVVLNFWATWCPPCVEELPMLNTFHQRQRGQGWSVLGVALDRAEAVRPFLQRMPLDFPVVMGGLGAIEWARALGNLSGGLPFTVVLNAQGHIVFRRLGRLHPEHLLQWAGLA
ncbi:MAG: TlpA disulfide reductase family protein [Rhodoferax sp.]